MAKLNIQTNRNRIKNGYQLKV